MNRWLASLFALSTLDCLLTAYWVGARGVDEANPILDAILQAHGFGALAAWKLVLTALGVYILARAATQRPRLCLWVVRVLVFWYTVLNLTHLYFLGVKQ